MALDGIVTQAIVHELQPFIGARIGKIYQPSTHDLIFTSARCGRRRQAAALGKSDIPPAAPDRAKQH